jgi:hypothetical protein
MKLKSNCFVIPGFLFLALCLVGATAPQSSTDKTKPASKKTDSGFEVFLLQAKATKDLDPLNNVPSYRYGSCPPGAVLDGMTVLANSGNDVIIVRLGIKVLPNYGGVSLSLPVLLDVGAKKYTSRNTMLGDSLQETLRRLKGTDEQLQCEFPFEIPRGTRVNKVQYEGVVFDLNMEDGSPTKPSLNVKTARVSQLIDPAKAG